MELENRIFVFIFKYLRSIQIHLKKKFMKLLESILQNKSKKHLSIDIVITGDYTIVPLES